MQNQVDKLEGVLVFDRPTFPDERGFFKEVLRFSEVEKALGQTFTVKQVNHSRSVKNTLRGIHVAPWNKLIYIPHGRVQSVIVDCRKDSSTFGKYQSAILGEENKACIFVPKGCGNSYLVLSDDADYFYLTDEEWAPNREKGVIWNDKDLGINWQLEGEPLLSEKDKTNPTFSQFTS
jgi:dTDP-4-dehydrorhamnose 3,5-epimerase